MRLDPSLDAPSMTGPSRDYHTMYSKESRWRDEPHNIAPGRVPVSMKLTKKVKTSEKPNYDLQPGRIPVLVRNSNINPAAEGVGDATSEWNVSAELLGQEDPGYTAPLSIFNGKTIVAGVVLGFLAFRIACR